MRKLLHGAESIPQILNNPFEQSHLVICDIMQQPATGNHNNTEPFQWILVWIPVSFLSWWGWIQAKSQLQPCQDPAEQDSSQSHTLLAYSFSVLKPLLYLTTHSQQGLTKASWYTLVHWTCLASLPARTMGRPSTSRYSWPNKIDAWEAVASKQAHQHQANGKNGSANKRE